MSEHKTYSISQLAAEFGVTTRTIRFYEEKGMLHPERSGQTRIFSNTDRVRLELILRGKRIGMSLEESREIIDMYDPAGGNIEQYRYLLEQIDKREAQLQSQLLDIQDLLGSLSEVRQRTAVALKQALAQQSETSEQE